MNEISDIFYRKGKVKPLEIVEKDDTGKFVNFFIRLGYLISEEDFDTASEFVCTMYGQSRVQDVDEARHKKLIAMTGKVDQVCRSNIYFVIIM